MQFQLTLLIAIAVVTSGLNSSPADPPPKRYDSAGNELTVYELEVSPAPEPPLAMKYRLLPDPADLKPGNAATHYYLALVFDGPSPFSADSFQKLSDHFFNDKKLTIEEIRAAIKLPNDFELYPSMRAGTYRAECDWGLRIREEGIYLVLPSVQQFRSIGILLSARVKLHIADRQFDEALALARDIFTLSRRMQEDQLLVQALVGIAISGMLHENFFLDWIAAPDSPNLYWSVSTIPTEFDVRRIISTELRFPELTFHDLEHIDKRTMTSEEAAGLAYRIWNSDRFAEAWDKNDLAGHAKLLFWATNNYQEAYRELEIRGYSKDRLDAMPVAQVALLSPWVRYQHFRDDLEKRALYANAHKNLPMLKDIEEMARKQREQIAPFHHLIPPFQGLASAQRRQARWLAAIATIEALRMYAADKGAWPAKLEDITQVPLPKNPDNNQPFDYKLDSDVAVLTLPYATGYTHEYRLKLRKK
jgi:hypothetical protein